MLQTIKQELLHKLEANFSRHLLSELVGTCVTYLSEYEQDDPIFIFIIQHVCFGTELYLEQIAPVSVSTHDEIEKIVKPSLIAAINALDDPNLYNKVSLFNNLVSKYHGLKSI